MSKLIATKQEFRKLLKKAFHDLSVPEKQKAFLEQQDQLNQQLSQFLANRQGIWGAYQALDSEVSINKALSLGTHLRWAYPRVEGDQMAFYIPGPRGFEKGTWSIEPVLEGATKVESLTGAIVPGLGFDRAGKRLGRGKGFYDRFLSDKKLLKVGVCLEALVVEELPVDKHDVGMDYLITDQSVRKIGS